MSRDPLADPAPLIRRVYAYVAYRIGDGPDAEDITSDVFERALRYRDSYKSSRGDPAAWLIGIARRCIADAAAARSTVERDVPEQAAPGEIAEDTVERLTLGRAVARLAPSDRELIALRYGGDLSAKQIAKVLDSRTNAVEVALHRALARLRVELEREGSPAARPRLGRAAES